MKNTIALSSFLAQLESFKLPEARKAKIFNMKNSANVADTLFISKFAEQLLKKLVPVVLREVFPDNPKILEAATRCEFEGTYKVARLARDRAGRAYFVPRGLCDKAYAAGSVAAYIGSAINPVHADTATDRIARAIAHAGNIDVKYVEMAFEIGVAVIHSNRKELMFGIK